MEKAKFEDLKQQREFFIKVKEKLGIGGKKLAKQLGLKSRGAIESYTSMRTAPPVEIIKKLEKISNLKAPRYEITNGKVFRKKRKFTPMKSSEAIKQLRDRFNEDFEYIEALVKSNLTLREINHKIRKKGYKFDNHKISLCLGAYRKSLLSNLSKKIIPKKKEIIISGFIRKENKTNSINFNLFPLFKTLEKKKIKVGLEISEDRKRVRIFPLDFGRVLNKGSGNIKILITELSGLHNREKIEIILNPNKFGFSLFDSIYDVDAKPLAREALESGFILDNYRSTPANHKADLSLYYEEKNIIIEITRAESYKGGYFKLGQCYIQKLYWPDSYQVLICKKKFLSKDTLLAFNKLKVNIIYSDFESNWEKKAIEELKKSIK